jgi:hypothetical protein
MHVGAGQRLQMLDDLFGDLPGIAADAAGFQLDRPVEAPPPPASRGSAVPAEACAIESCARTDSLPLVST